MTSNAATAAAPFGPAPNLTEHFKQALNMTRNQFQGGSNPLGASTQMGVNAPHLSNFGAPQSGMASTPAVDGNFDLPSSLHQQQHTSSNNLLDWVKTNSTWIIIISSAIIVGLGVYFYWWRIRKSTEHFSTGQNLALNQADLVHNRQSNQMDDYSDRTQRFIPQRPLHQQRPQQQTQQNAQNPQPFSSIDEKKDNIRGNEQQMSQRGAEFANPSFVSQMMPISTRISSPSQPPSQPQQQQSMQIPISQPAQPMQIPISQTTQPTQSMQIPVSQLTQPTQSIPPPPIVSSDPNFTAL